jgi:hypothetical protein
MYAHFKRAELTDFEVHTAVGFTLPVWDSIDWPMVKPWAHVLLYCGRKP